MSELWSNWSALLTAELNGREQEGLMKAFEFSFEYLMPSLRVADALRLSYEGSHAYCFEGAALTTF